MFVLIVNRRAHKSAPDIRQYVAPRQRGCRVLSRHLAHAQVFKTLRGANRASINWCNWVSTPPVDSVEVLEVSRAKSYPTLPE